MIIVDAKKKNQLGSKNGLLYENLSLQIGRMELDGILLVWLTSSLWFIQARGLPGCLLHHVMVRQFHANPNCSRLFVANYFPQDLEFSISNLLKLAHS